MSEQTDSNEGYMISMKEKIFEWCCDQLLDFGKHKVKQSDCKEAFMTLHPNLLTKIFSDLVFDNSIELDTSSGRTVVYNIFTPKVITFCTDRTALKLKLEAAKDYQANSNQKVNKGEVKAVPQPETKLNKRKQDENTTHKNYKSKFSQPIVIKSVVLEPVIGESTITTWGNTSPVKVASKVACSVVDHLMELLNASFKKSGQESLTLTELKRSILDSTKKMEISEEQLALGLEQLSGEDKIMCYDDEIYRV